MSSPAKAKRKAVPAESGVESIRERRKRELRQQLSDVATRMFLEHGFDAVRVADVARACGVTEKTVFNHFRSKEALIVDRWDTTTAALVAGLVDPGVAPVDAAVAVLEQELAFLTGSPDDDGARLAEVHRFGELIRSTPSLVVHNQQALQRMTAAAATALAQREDLPYDDPVAWIIANALGGLWGVFARSLHRHLPEGDATRVRRAVTEDLHRGADTLRRGL